MQSAQWYELRVQGSVGTREGAQRGTHEGIAIADDGYVCSLGSPHVKHFESEQAALEYLKRCTIPGKHQFEIVLCHENTAN